MMADKKYYAQFDGDEVDGKRYALGDTIADSVDAGTIAYLVGMGRISSTPPGEASKDPGNFALGDDSDPKTAQAKVLADLDPMDMTRAELVACIAELSTDGIEDDRLRAAIYERRERNADDAKREAGEGGSGEGGNGDEPTEEDVILRAILGGNVDAVKSTVAEMTDKAKLNRLRELEIAGGDRAGVKKAIDDKVASLEA